ncbi:MAG TPA: lipopolysaccharide biosynthesis protein [Janthinobacterium sp.]|nr:lipopolysaccharide biosynthesis protein [Janthinobacterium sp.]
MVAIRWSDRLIGLLSTLVLARLLLPQDIGIIAMASMMIGLIDSMLDTGVSIALIQNRGARQDDYDAAWTLRLMQSLLATVLIYALAGVAAKYFHDARVEPVIEVLALSNLLAAVENIGVVSFQKNMEFGLEFRFFFIKRCVGFVITMIAAWILRDYWALVAGNIGGRIFGAVFSYVIHPMRARISFTKMGNILSFASWNLLRSIANYLNTNAHGFLVGHRASPFVLGEYTYGSEIAALPSTELLAPISRVLFPTFVSLKDDPPALKESFLLALAVQTMIGIPAGAGMALLAHDMVRVLLGPKWMDTAAFIQIMGAINIIGAIGASGGYVLLALGRAKIIAFNSWLQVLVFLAIAVLVLPKGGAMVIAMLRMGIACGGLITFLCLVMQELPMLRAASLLAAVWRPSVASLAMACALPSVSLPLFVPDVVQLFLKVVIGAIIFSASVLLLWRIAGRPAGAETYLGEKFNLYLRGRAVA